MSINKIYKKSLKNRLYLKALSLCVLFNLTFVIIPAFELKDLADKDLLVGKVEQKGLLAEKSGQAEKEDSKINKELKEKLDLLRVAQVLSSVKIFDDASSIIAENEWQELELDKVLENWDKYKKTKFDIWGVKSLLKYAPAGSKELIRLLVEDDQAYDALSKIMDKVALAQDQLMSYWNDFDELNNDSKQLYFSFLNKVAPKVNDNLNSNETILGVSHSFEYISRFVRIFAITGLEGVFDGFLISKMAKYIGYDVELPGWKENFINGIFEPVRAHNPFPNVYKDGYYGYMFFDTERLSFGDKYIIGKATIKSCIENVVAGEKFKSVLAGTVSALALVGWQGFKDYMDCVALYKAGRKIAFLYNTTGKLQENLVKVADMLRALNKLQDGCFKIKNEECFAIQNITKFLKREGFADNSKNCAGLNKLLDNLGSDTFKKKTSTYNAGHLLGTHKLMNELKSQLVPLLQNIALMGGYRAIAQIVREHKNSRTKFCFVDFVGSKPSEIKYPEIKMENAWIPLISEDKVVTNDINFGINGLSRNAVVTGPNGGGKSTFMITAAFNVLLSKLGIAAADKASMTDFDKIRTSLRPMQDVSNGLSSFMAEHKRVAEVKNVISSCNGNILVLLDEPYKGTVEIESAIRVYEFGKYLATNCPNCILLMATHLKRPIDLEVDTNGVFKNYQMGYIENGACSFERTFKVQDGPAIWWFDDAVRRSRFIDWLCANEIGG